MSQTPHEGPRGDSQEDPHTSTPTWHGATTEPYPAPPAPGSPDGGRTSNRRAAALTAGAVLAAALLGGAYLVVDRTPADSRAGISTQQPAADPAPVVQAAANAPDWTATADAVAPSVVSITLQTASGGDQGSGVILDKAGHILTNHHVVAAGLQGTSRLLVTLNDKRTFPAKVVGSDASTDLAVVAIDSPPADLRPIALGDSKALKVGAPVMAVGNPLGLSGTVTTGIVSALDRPVIACQSQSDPSCRTDPQFSVTSAVQTSAAINPGNSGGALVDASGRLVGINSSIAQTARNGGNIGIGFAIPVHEAKSVSDQILRTGSVKHPFLGVGSKDGFVAEGSAQRAAAVVEQVTPGTPAAQAGIRAGDAVVALDGNPVDGQRSLAAQVRGYNVGDKITVTIVRGGTRQDVSATLAERPDDGR